MDKRLSATFIQKKQVAQNTYEITFGVPSGKFAFKAGQYIWLVFPQEGFADAKGNRRAFSITSSSIVKNEFSILIRVSDSVYKNSLLKLEVGDVIDAIGPFGSSFTYDPNSTVQLIMFAGGVGISPFISLIRSYSHEFGENKPILVNNNQSAELISYSSEIAEYANNRVIKLYNQIGEFKESHLPGDIDYRMCVFYVSGPQEFVNEVNTALTARGVTFEQMHCEQYYPQVQNSLKEEDFLNTTDPKFKILVQAIFDSRSHTIITDPNGIIIFANTVAQRYTGYSFPEMRGHTPRLWGALMEPAVYQAMWKSKKYEGGFDGELLNRRKTGQLYRVIAHVSPILDESKNIIGYIGTEEDISDKLVLESKLMQKIEELQRMNNFMVKRELRMKELKEEIEKLKGDQR